MSSYDSDDSRSASQQSDGFGLADDAAMGAALVVSLATTTLKQTETQIKSSSVGLCDDFVVMLEQEVEDNPETFGPVPNSHITIGHNDSLAIPTRTLMNEHIKQLLDSKYDTIVPFKYAASNIDKDSVIRYLLTVAWRVAIRRLKPNSRADVFEVNSMVVVSDDQSWKEVVEDRLRVAQVAYLASQTKRKFPFYDDYTQLQICLWLPNRIPGKWKVQLWPVNHFEMNPQNLDLVQWK